MELKANILRIERLSLSDGKGMRTVVFFKGCPLRCAWCSTPESQSGQREVYYMKERCTGCGACANATRPYVQQDDVAEILERS